MSREKLVEIKGLKTRFKVGDNWAEAVNGVDLDIYKGEMLGIVGESGSGKSVSVLSLIQLIPNPPGEVSEGEIIFKGEKIFDGKELDRVKETPKYRFYNHLNENLRKSFALVFFMGWYLLYTALPFSGILIFIISLIIGSTLTGHLFFSSPRKKMMKQFRESMFKRMWDLRGDAIAMIFQEPMTSLNPVFTVGMQIVESLYPKSLTEYLKDWCIRTSRSLKIMDLKYQLRTSLIFGFIVLIFSQLAQGWTFNTLNMIGFFIGGSIFPTLIMYLIIFLNYLISEEYHQEYDRLLQEGIELLELVGIPDPVERMSDYPHQFSGGMRQRAMIAMALAKNPSLLIADEPTTALDVTIQAQILDLMKDLKNKKMDASVVLITHDMAVIAETCERVVVLYGGVIQEVASVGSLFDSPLHPYTQGLLKSIPHPDEHNPAEKLETISGIVPNIVDLPSGCKFCTRCELVEDRCHTEEPSLFEISSNHFVRCHVVAEGGMG